MLALLAAVQLLVESGALQVDTGADAKLPCAANAALAQAIKIRLPKVKLKGRGRLAPGDLSGQLSATAQGFRFEVRDQTGAVAMSRDVYCGCSQLGDTAALILDRYLADISWAGRDVGLVPDSPPAPAPRPAPRDSPPPVVVVVAAEPDAGPPIESAELMARIGVAPAAPESPPAEPPPRATAAVDAGTAPLPPIVVTPPQPPDPLLTEVTITAGGGGWLGAPLALAPALSLDAAVLLRHRLRVALLGLGSLPSTHDVTTDTHVLRGTVQSFDLLALLTAGLCTDTALTFCGSAAAGSRIRWASASPSSAPGPRLNHTASGALALPELGLDAWLAFRLPAHLIIALELLVAAPLGQSTFKFTGFEGSDLTTPPLDVVGTLRLGVRI